MLQADDEEEHTVACSRQTNEGKLPQSAGSGMPYSSSSASAVNFTASSSCQDVNLSLPVPGLVL
jgi:hypothetical protein